MSEGLGEMTAKQLKETTMNPASRTLIKIDLFDEKDAVEVIEKIMGKKPEYRFKFIQEHMMNKGAEMLDDLDV